MSQSTRAVMGLAALAGLMSIAFGALAAHGVSDPTAQTWLRIGSNYQLAHAVAAWAGLAAMPRRRAARCAGWAFITGALIFSGTLYAMALGAPRWFGAITPIGGVVMMAGWTILAWAAFRSSADSL